MRGDQQVIEYLNKALRHELAAVNQYWLHYRILDNWGYKDFAKTWREELIEEMRHADQLVARILFLDGQPNMQSLDPLRIGKGVKEILECDLAAEMDARALYLEAARYCEQVNDRVSKNLFEATDRRRGKAHRFPRGATDAGRAARRSALRAKAHRRAGRLSADTRDARLDREGVMASLARAPAPGRCAIRRRRSSCTGSSLLRSSRCSPSAR